MGHSRLAVPHAKRQAAAISHTTVLVDTARAVPVERRIGQGEGQILNGRGIHRDVCRIKVSESKVQVEEAAKVQLLVIRRRWR